jgi:hypothetical protein
MDARVKPTHDATLFEPVCSAGSRIAAENYRKAAVSTTEYRRSVAFMAE